MGYLPHVPVIVILAGFAIALSGCSPRDEAPEPAPAEPAAPAVQPIIAPPPLPLPPPADRRALLTAVNAAAAAHAAGEAYPSDAQALAGRRFAVRLAFGCGGRLASGSSVRLAYDPTKQTLQATALPETWTDAEWARAGVAPEKVEAIEGFWIRRPWLLAESCPAEHDIEITPVAEAAPAQETVALAQIYEKGGSRLLRRSGRPYEITRKIPPEQAPSAEGLRLVLEGRLVTGPTPIHCHSAGADHRPVCLINVQFERVAFEDPAGRMISEWRP